MEYRKSHLNKGAIYDENLQNDGFDNYMAEQEKNILQQIIPALYKNKIKRYLDFACGTGRITQLVEKMAEEPYGIDISENMIEQAREKCTLTKFVVGDFTRDRFPEKDFNLITSFRFFANAEDDLRISALKAINKLLIVKEYFILNNHRNPWGIINALQKIAGKKEAIGRFDLHYWKLKKLLKDSGFNIVNTYGIGFWLIRAKLMKHLDTDIARKLDRITRSRFLSAFCPDYIIVAQKERNC
jgi:SAM-dependent methyltransferase